MNDGAECFDGHVAHAGIRVVARGKHRRPHHALVRTTVVLLAMLAAECVQRASSYRAVGVLEYVEEIPQRGVVGHPIDHGDAPGDDSHIRVAEPGSHCGQGVGSRDDQRASGDLRSVLDGEIVDVLGEGAGLGHGSQATYAADAAP